MPELEHYKFNNGGSPYATRGDCVIRAITIATEQNYLDVLYDLKDRQKRWWENSNTKHAKDKKPNSYKAYKGVYREVYQPYLEELGWKWKPTMGIGTGCKIHLKASELPKGRIICSLTKHLVAVVDGVIQDIYDPSRDETRCVYGYFYIEKNNENLKGGETL